MSKFSFQINTSSTQLKFQQLVDAVIDAVNRNLLEIGDPLPSVNHVVNESKLSRDTVFKAYAELKKRGVIESVPNKGYFIAQETTKVFLFLDTFKAYKEVLYGSFREALPDNINVDLHFHHYNIELFEKIITENIGRYSKYIVMNFDHEKVSSIIKKIPQDKLLIIDWAIHADDKMSYIYQDFGQELYNSLEKNIELIKKYDRFIYLYPPNYTYHPQKSIIYFEKFAKHYNLSFDVQKNIKMFDVKKDELYLLVSDRTLAMFLDQCESKKLIPGIDTGVISYNETPMKKYVKEGITVISTDFELMGQKAAEFVITGKPMKIQIPTTLKVRSSL